ncbi:MAG TPA: hypothetical protein VJ891_01900 [Casimicrobiaceae bacterium]|nr:hypothetical protein [Casimicrobiaceae bacterium]
MTNLKGAKEIAQAITLVWKIPISVFQVHRFAEWPEDPLPIFRQRRPGMSRGPVSADPALVEAWAIRNQPLQ